MSLMRYNEHQQSTILTLESTLVLPPVFGTDHASRARGATGFGCIGPPRPVRGEAMEVFGSVARSLSSLLVGHLLRPRPLGLPRLQRPPMPHHCRLFDAYRPCAGVLRPPGEVRDGVSCCPHNDPPMPFISSYPFLVPSQFSHSFLVCKFVVTEEATDYLSRKLPEARVTFVFIFTDCRYSLSLLLCSYHSNATLVCIVIRRIPASIRHLLQAESGANDGIALPLVILPVMLIQSIHTGEGTGEVLGKWIYEVWLYQVTKTNTRTTLGKTLFLCFACRPVSPFADSSCHLSCKDRRLRFLRDVVRV